MPSLEERGIIHIFLIFILLLGIIAGVYLVKNTQIFKPKADENGQLNVIDNLKRSLSYKTTNDIFVYLEIKSPTWPTQTSLNNPLIKLAKANDESLPGSNQSNSDPDPSSYQYTNFLRVSLNQDKLNKDSDCEITGDPETNCQEIVLDNPTNKVYLSWVLPKKSGDYTVFVRFFSNKNNTKDLNTSITYKNSDEIDYKVPTILIGGQALITTVIDALRKIPGTAALNAAAVFIYQVHSVGEQIITLSHAQQLGFSVDLTPGQDGEVDLLYEPNQLSKLDISMEFFPEPDPITGEPRLQINPKANPTDEEDRIQASLDIALGEIGGRIIGHFINAGVTRVAESNAIKTIKSKIRITPKEGEITTPPANTGNRGVTPRGFGRIGGLFVKNIAKMNSQEKRWFFQIQPMLQTGEAYILDPNFSWPIIRRLITNVEVAYKNHGLPSINKKAIEATIDNNWIVVIPDHQMSRIFNSSEINAAAFAADRLIVISESAANNELVLVHEFVHVISANFRRFGSNGIKPIGVYFNYNQEQAEMYGATMSQIYELFTEEIVRVFYGQSNTYEKLYPQLYNSLLGFIRNLIQISGGKLTFADFAVFALTGNDKVLMQSMIKNGITPDIFMRVLNKTLDARKLALMLKDYRTSNRSWLIPVGVGGGAGAVFIGTLYASSAHGEELSSDVSIIYERPTQDIDLSLPKEETENSLNCSYSEENSDCPSGFIVCSGHSDESICSNKKPSECFNLTVCHFDQSLGSSCSCSN